MVRRVYGSGNIDAQDHAPYRAGSVQEESNAVKIRKICGVMMDG
jgi:hypothetical protein